MRQSEKDSQAMIRLAILASGGGSNADKICEYFHEHDKISVACIISNKATAGVRDIAGNHHIPFEHLTNDQFINGQEVIKTCKTYQVDAIILAGFLRKIPAALIKAFSNKIINIHPALLPKFGGKGMYGQHVHQAVYDSKEKTSGSTIHLVNENYDEGTILFQAETELTPNDHPIDIAKKVLHLEHKYYAPVIEEYLQSQPFHP